MYNRIRHEIYRVGIVLTRTLLNGSSPLYVQASLWKLYYQFSKMLDYLREHNNDNIKLKAKQNCVIQCTIVLNVGNGMKKYTF